MIINQLSKSIPVNAACISGQFFNIQLLGGALYIPIFRRWMQADLDFRVILSYSAIGDLLGIHENYSFKASKQTNSKVKQKELAF